ncbi:hypothetical protein SDC9_183547 [bioreactor metagenome]|uniref:Uncharacterized protein n=1 Tax=bioreactor metagenome TaxID=1076179 RepID=A0A645HCE1_9ZZZZ
MNGGKRRLPAFFNLAHRRLNVVPEFRVAILDVMQFFIIKPEMKFILDDGGIDKVINLGKPGMLIVNGVVQASG